MTPEQVKTYRELRRCLYDMQEGKERRKAIVTWFEKNPEGEILVDVEGCQQVHKDSDLKKLVKKGFLKKIRQHWFPHHSKSYLVKA